MKSHIILKKKKNMIRNNNYRTVKHCEAGEA